MYQIKRAIIMAAGKGERLRPVTDQIPKPLIKVNGVPMIETIIQALIQNGIREIYVVIGYLKEQFGYLCQQYGVNLIDNPYYDSCNNIASLYVARNHLEDAMILDGDQIISKADILDPFFEKSGYHAVWTEQETAEWLMQVSDGTVTSCSREGGKIGWQLFSVSRWCSEDGKKLKKHLEIEFEQNKNRQIYWDDVPMFCHFEDYDLGIFPMQFGDIIEIDQLQELIALDSSYTEGRNDERNTDEKKN